MISWHFWVNFHHWASCIIKFISREISQSLVKSPFNMAAISPCSFPVDLSGLWFCKWYFLLFVLNGILLSQPPNQSPFSSVGIWFYCHAAQREIATLQAIPNEFLWSTRFEGTVVVLFCNFQLQLTGVNVTTYMKCFSEVLTHTRSTW